MNLRQTPKRTTPAAVALILREGERGSEVLFIRRAVHEGDPWSGNLAFPGGKIEAGEDPQRAAERETMEEIGLDLTHAVCSGQLPEVSGSYLPVRVFCFVYRFCGTVPEMCLNSEVQDTLWVNLADLDDASCHLIAPVTFGGERFEAPAIRLQWPGAPVLWGLTYRLIMNFIEMYHSEK